jgi:small subunit ribosomal protein S27Ae
VRFHSTLFHNLQFEGDTLARTRTECPKCGAGFFMASHKDRYYCGNCHHTLFFADVKK